jgi:beta-xylosidase
MTVRHFKEKVQKDYIRHVTNFKDFLGRSPDTATSDLVAWRLCEACLDVEAASIMLFE